MKKLANGNYELTRDELEEFLDHYHRYRALDFGGVDNWDWYGESYDDYLNEYREEKGTDEYYMEDLVKDEMDGLDKTKEKENLWNGK